MAPQFLLFGNYDTKKCLLARMRISPYLCTSKIKELNNKKIKTV